MFPSKRKHVFEDIASDIHVDFQCRQECFYQARRLRPRDPSPALSDQQAVGNFQGPDTRNSGRDLPERRGSRTLSEAPGEGCRGVHHPAAHRLPSSIHERTSAEET